MEWPGPQSASAPSGVGFLRLSANDFVCIGPSRYLLFCLRRRHSRARSSGVPLQRSVLSRLPKRSPVMKRNFPIKSWCRYRARCRPRHLRLPAISFVPPACELQETIVSSPPNAIAAMFTLGVAFPECREIMAAVGAAASFWSICARVPPPFIGHLRFCFCLG